MNRNPHCPKPPAGLTERRSERRQAAAGDGWLEPLEGGAREDFRLVDVSPGGFRGRHRCPALAAGQKVRFCHGHAKGVAVVMWNRVLGGEVESGFLIVSRPL